MIMTVLGVLFTLLYLASKWQMYEKAGQRGWIGIIPGLSHLGALKMIGAPFWWLLFYIPPLTPFTHLVISVMVARRFGKSALFGAGMAYFPMFFCPIVGFGSARYLGPGR
jgi:hypothetical protein